MKKVWTPAARKAFALKMQRARAVKGGHRKRRGASPKLRVGQIVDWKTGEGFMAVTRGKKILSRHSTMAEAQAAYKTRRRRRKNPTKAQVKAAAGRIAKKAAALAWAGTKRTARFGGRVAGAGAKAAAAEVKASICRTRAKNPKNKGFQVRIGSARKRKLVWTAMTRADAIHVAKVYAKAYPRKVVSVHAEK